MPRDARSLSVLFRTVLHERTRQFVFSAHRETSLQVSYVSLTRSQKRTNLEVGFPVHTDHPHSGSSRDPPRHAHLLVLYGKRRRIESGDVRELHATMLYRFPLTSNYIDATCVEGWLKLRDHRKKEVEPIKFSAGIVKNDIPR